MNLFFANSNREGSTNMTEDLEKCWNENQESQVMEWHPIMLPPTEVFDTVTVQGE